MKLIQFLYLSFFSVVPLLSVSAQSELNVEIDTQPIKTKTDAAVLSYADVLEEATPSVVAVYTARYINFRAQEMPDILRQFGIPVPSPNSGPDNEQGRQRQRLGVGSGVIVSADGYILTNHHVISGPDGRGADEILVRLTDDREFKAELIGSDDKTDVAVLKIETGKPLPAIAVADSTNLRVGDVVFAIGNPLEVGLTATQGIVSATGRNSLGILGDGGYENFIQTDAAINMGNSGGALIDALGRLVGINTAIISRSGGSNGIGFAIPSMMVVSVAKNLVERGEVPRGLLGLYPTDLNPDLVDAFGLESTQGALVNQVQEGSPADNSGIKHGDVITKIDDVTIVSAAQLRLTVSQMMPGREVSVKLIRNGEAMEIPVVLGSVSGTVATKVMEQSVLEGVRLAVISPEMREELEIPKEIQGVMVASVEGSSPYFETLASGMVLVEVNGSPVASPEEVAENLKDGANRIYSWLRGTNRFIVLRVEE